MRNKPYRFRCDPVPRTGRFRGGHLRRVRHWFRRYRQDHIPEHRPYIREKAMLADLWDDEVWHAGPYKSWKDTSKKRHQWE